MTKQPTTTRGGRTLRALTLDLADHHNPDTRRMMLETATPELWAYMIEYATGTSKTARRLHHIITTEMSTK